MKPKEKKERADLRERAQLAIGILADAGDPTYEISDDMIRMRQAYAAIAGGEDSPEVVQELMEAMAGITAFLDDLLCEMYEVMEPEEVEEMREELEQSQYTSETAHDMAQGKEEGNST